MAGRAPHLPLIGGMARHSTRKGNLMKTLIATALVAASLLAGIASVSTSANAADFGTRAWWSEQSSNG